MNKFIVLEANRLRIEKGLAIFSNSVTDVFIVAVANLIEVGIYELDRLAITYKLEVRE